MSLAVNDGCNARCSHCSFYEGVDRPGRVQLSLEQQLQAIREARELGVSVINLVGGEPLLCDQLEALVAGIDTSLSSVLWRLPPGGPGLESSQKGGRPEGARGPSLSLSGTWGRAENGR